MGMCLTCNSYFVLVKAKQIIPKEQTSCPPIQTGLALNFLIILSSMKEQQEQEREYMDIPQQANLTPSLYNCLPGLPSGSFNYKYSYLHYLTLSVTYPRVSSKDRLTHKVCKVQTVADQRAPAKQISKTEPPSLVTRSEVRLCFCFLYLRLAGMQMMDQRYCLKLAMVAAVSSSFQSSTGHGLCNAKLLLDYFSLTDQQLTAWLKDDSVA